jgi:hypothetical protein
MAPSITAKAWPDARPFTPTKVCLRCGVGLAKKPLERTALSWATSLGTHAMHDREIDQIIATNKPIRGQVRLQELPVFNTTIIYLYRS